MDCHRPYLYTPPCLYDSNDNLITNRPSITGVTPTVVFGELHQHIADQFSRSDASWVLSTRV
jgi:hypothetical protein